MNVSANNSAEPTGFEKHVTPETLESLLHGPLERQPLQHGRIEFVLAFVRGDGAAEVSERIGRVADIAISHGAVVYDLVGALAVMAFGTLRSSPEPGSRPSLVAALHDELPDDLKIVHGAADGDYGLFGNERRISYTFLVPRFDAILGTLSRLKFGEIEEFRQ